MVGLGTENFDRPSPDLDPAVALRGYGGQVAQDLRRWDLWA